MFKNDSSNAYKGARMGISNKAFTCNVCKNYFAKRMAKFSGIVIAKNGFSNAVCKKKFKGGYKRNSDESTGLNGIKGARMRISKLAGKRISIFKKNLCTSIAKGARIAVGAKGCGRVCNDKCIRDPCGPTRVKNSIAIAFGSKRARVLKTVGSRVTNTLSNIITKDVGVIVGKNAIATNLRSKGETSISRGICRDYALAFSKMKGRDAPCMAPVVRNFASVILGGSIIGFGRPRTVRGKVFLLRNFDLSPTRPMGVDKGNGLIKAKVLLRGVERSFSIGAPLMVTDGLPGAAAFTGCMGVRTNDIVATPICGTKGACHLGGSNRALCAMGVARPSQGLKALSIV